MDPVSTTYAATPAGSAAYGFSPVKADVATPSASDARQGSTPSPDINAKDTVTLGAKPANATDQDFKPYGPDGRQNSDAKPAARPGTPQTAAPDQKQQDPQVEQEIARLKATEEKVKAHEAAHKSAGGAATGPISYTYTRGPDGRSYITGGEVPITISTGRTPEETRQRMQQVIQAALAPADPSPQDRAVAAQAANIAQQASQEQRTSDPSGASDTSGSSGSSTSSASATTDSARTTNSTTDGTAKSATLSPRVEDTISGVVARISRQSYSDPAVNAPSATTDTSASSQVRTAAVPLTQSQSQPGRSPLQELNPAMITGFAPHQPVSLFA